MGRVAAVQAAVSSSRAGVGGNRGGIFSSHVIPRPNDEVDASNI